MTIIYACILGIILCNIAIVLIASKRGAERERAKLAAPNVVILARYRRGSIVDRVA